MGSMEADKTCGVDPPLRSNALYSLVFLQRPSRYTVNSFIKGLLGWEKKTRCFEESRDEKSTVQPWLGLGTNGLNLNEGVADKS